MSKNADKWLKDCLICNAGLCTRVKELLSEGKTERQASREMEQEQGESVYSAEAILQRYRYHTSKKGSCQSDTQKRQPKLILIDNRLIDQEPALIKPKKKEFKPKEKPHLDKYAEEIGRDATALSNKLRRIRPNVDQIYSEDAKEIFYTYLKTLQKLIDEVLENA
jgi:hypothetical protein